MKQALIELVSAYTLRDLPNLGGVVHHPLSETTQSPRGLVFSCEPHTKKTDMTFDPLNPGCLIGIPDPWYMKHIP